MDEVDNDLNGTIKHGNTGGFNDLSDDFICSVCLRVLVQPTTLVCGHTSCRICLAHWYFSSQKKECPLCRQPYQGHPKVNAHIKSMIAKLYPKELKERDQELSQNEEDKITLQKYDDALSKGIEWNRKNSSAFCLGVALAVIVFIIAHLAWYWQSSENNLLVMKPVQLWKPEDVASWLEDLSWASIYVNKSLEKNIDGNMLLAMDNESIELLLNISDPLHERAILLAIDGLRERKTKIPSTLWEYKALYPGRCLFLIHGLKEFPRATLLYLWLYFYDEMFLPFVKTATDSPEEIMNITSSTVERISTLQWMYFLLSAVVFPQWLVIVLAYQTLTHHVITSFFVISMATLNQLLEILNVINIYRHHWQAWNISQILKNYVKQLLHTFMFMVVWPVIPRFLCDVLFYMALYIGPFRTFGRVFKKLVELLNP